MNPDTPPHTPADQPNDQPTAPNSASEQAPPAAPPAPTPAPTPVAAPVGAGASLSAEVEAEIDAAMADLDEAKGETAAKPVVGAKPKLRGPRVVQGGREYRTGTVVSVGANDVFVEFGPKELGVVERTQWKEGADLPAVGEALKVAVVRYNREESLFMCTLPGAVQKAEWEMLEPGQTIEARVTGVNKGGLELEIANHRAFMPASQVALERIEDLSVFVGEKIECQVQRIDRRGSGNIVLSRREILEKQKSERAEELKTSIKIGDQLDGTVRRIAPFGAFVDIGGIDGLIHLDDLSHERVGYGEKGVEKHVTVGDKVRVQVLKLDWDSNRIGLGLKQLQDDPFQSVTAELAEGAELTGRVTRIADFGCFVEVQPGVEGLVHISELAWKRVAHPSDIVKEDEVVKVQVIKIDPDSRKLSLSIKQTTEAPKREGGGGPGGGGRGGKGRRGRGDRDERSPEEILKETPAYRRLKEQHKTKAKDNTKDSGGLGGLSDFGGGIGLGDLKL